MINSTTRAWSLNETDSFLIDPEDQLEIISRQTRYFYAFTLVFSALFVFGIVFNLLSIISILNSKNFTPINLLILSLAFSDIAYTMSIPLFAAHLFAKSWPFGELGCRVFYLIDMIGMNVSVLTITALSIERFIDVTSKLKNWKLFTQKTKLRAILIYIALSWIFSIILAFPFVLSVRLVNFNNVYTCGSTWNEKITRSYFTLKLVTSFVIPYILITISSSKLLIFLKRWRSGSSLTASSSFSVLSTDLQQNSSLRTASSVTQSTVFETTLTRADGSSCQIANEKPEDAGLQTRSKRSRSSASTKYRRALGNRMRKSASLMNKLSQSRLEVEKNPQSISLTASHHDASPELSSQNIHSTATCPSGMAGSDSVFSNDNNTISQLESPTEEKMMLEPIRPKTIGTIKFISKPKTDSQQSPTLQHNSATKQPRFISVYKKRSSTFNLSSRRASMPYVFPKRSSNTTILPTVLENNPQGFSYIYSVRRKAIRLVLIIILSFFIQWTPLWLFHTIILYVDTNINLEYLHLINIIVSVLAYSNSVANPTLYMLVTYNFKEFYKNKFKRRLPKSRSNISTVLNKSLK